MIARVVVLSCVVILALPASAFAQAFEPLPPPQPQTPQTVIEDANAEEDDDGMSPTQQLLIGLGGFVLLGGIAWLILRDARGAAPAPSRDVPGPGEAPQPKGSQTPARVRHRQSRAKAKAARRARKKARKR
ncbi:MAG TPA: hypothetical protein VHF89_05105 [Solirubrobacteraceae bacterium]|nr:hypothetical protein [Solirubrobacteraceae bacterium]